MAVLSRAVVSSVLEHTEDLREYIILPENYRRYDAGTFLQLTLSDVNASDYWPESRTFSIASGFDKEKKEIRLIIRKTGKYTTKIFEELRVGKVCTIKYPFGDMILPQFDKGKIVCIAAGSGIAPFLSFIDDLKNNGEIERLELFYTVRKEQDFISYQEIKNSLDEKKLHLFCTDEKSKIANNRLMNLNDIISNSTFLEKHYYICGSPKFMEFFKNELHKVGIKKIYLDEWE